MAQLVPAVAGEPGGIDSTPDGARGGSGARRSPAPAGGRWTRRRAVTGIALAVAAGSLLRLRFLDVPLNTDEAGYAEVARLWTRGYPLYGQQAWVDRPQGLLLAYRLVAATAWDPTVRILAVLAAAIVAVAVAAAAWALAGRRAGVIAAVLFAVLSVAPHLEGFTANGELLGAAFTSTAVALAAWWWARGRHETWLLALAGVAAGISPLIKQSAFDALVAVAIFIVVVETGAARRKDPKIHVNPTSEGRFHRNLRVWGAFLGGALVPVALAVAHAAAIGFSAWWFAVIGHRSQTESLLNGPFDYHVELFRASLGPFWRDIGVLVPFVVVGAVAAGRAKRLTLPLSWLLAAAVGFALGGLYHPHYWIQLVGPMVLLAALGLDAIARRSAGLALGLGAAVLVVPLAFALPVYGASSNERASQLSSKDGRILSARAIGDYVDSISKPGDEMAVLWANAALYWEADRAPAFRYMWFAWLSQNPSAAAAARATITGPHPPAVVVGATDIGQLDPTGAVRRALAERYTLERYIAGVPIYRLRSTVPSLGDGLPSIDDIFAGTKKE